MHSTDSLWKVSFMELSHKAPTLAVFVADAPTEMLKIFDETAFEVVLAQFKRYGHGGIGLQELHVRITELPICDSLRDIRKIHLNTLIKATFTPQTYPPESHMHARLH